MSSHPGCDLPEALLRQVARLAGQLERLSADSPYAALASGIRGALLKIVGCHMAQAGWNSSGITSARLASLEKLIEAGSRLPLLAAK